MQTVDADLISGKKVLLRMDLDVPLERSKIKNQKSKLMVGEDFRLKAGLPTLKMCLEHADAVYILGHIGRPQGKEVSELSTHPIAEWLEVNLKDVEFEEEKLHVLENLRFDPREEECSLEFAKELAELGDIFVNEAFASHHPAASTTILPTLLPHLVGLRFAEEVRVLQVLRERPKKPLVAIIGGVKVEDKYPVIVALSKFCDAVLVGGLLAKTIKEENLEIGSNVMLGKLRDDELGLAEETIEAFARVIGNSKQVIWGGPVGKYEVSEGIEGDKKLAEAIISSGVESIIGGGDTIACLNSLGYLDKMNFISTGGGVMLKFLSGGTLPTIEVLK